MPATAQSNASAGYVDFDEYVDFQIEKTRHSIKLTDIVTAVAGVAAFVLGYLLLFAVLDHWVIPGGFGQTARFLMVSGLLLVTGSWLAWKVVLPYLKQVSGLYAARTIESSAPGLKSTLLNLVDLRRAGREIPVDIRNTLEKRAAQALSKMDVDQAVDRKPLMRTAYVLLGLVVLACLYSVFSPKKLSVVRAFLPPVKAAPATRTMILDVQTDPPLTRTAEREVDVVARSQLAVIVDLSGEVPDEVTLHFTTADRKFVDEPITMQLVEEGLKQYRGILNGENGRGILQSMTFHVVAGDAVSDEYRVLVNQPPAATVDEVRYIYPDYMELESKLQTGANIDAWEGTKVSLAATVNQPVKTAILQFFDDEDAETKAEEMRMEISANNRLRAEWTLKFRTDGTFPRSYRIFCVTDEGQSDPEPTLYTQIIRPDRRPVVEILEPRGDLEVPANAIVPLLIEARDPDFKLRYVTLRRQKNGEVLPRSPEIFKGLQQQFRGEWDFDLQPMNLKPGDVVTYWAEARDNKQPLGNLSEKRQLLELHIIDRIPQEDVEKQADEDRAKIKQRIEEAEENENPEGQPEQQQQQEAGQDEEPQEGGNEPKPGEGESQDSKDGNEEDRGEGNNDKKPGNEGAKPSDDESNKPGEEGKPQPGDQKGKQQQGERPLDTDGEDDTEALRRLLEKARKEQQQKNKNNDAAKKPDNKEQGDKKPGEKGEPQSDNKSDAPEGKQPDDQRPEDADDKSSAKDGPSAETGGDKKPGEEDQTKEGSDPDKDQKPDEGKQPDGAGKQGGDDSKQAGSDKGQSEGQPSKGENSKNDNPGQGGGDKPSQDAKNPKSADKPLDGKETPADPSENAERRKATGDEKGPATADNDPKADPTKAKNELERKEGEKPNTRPNKEKPIGDARKKQQDGMGSKNPNAAQPAPDTKNGNKPKPGENPDKRPTPPKESNPDSPAAKQDEQPDKGNEELKGKGREDGQSSQKPQGGEEGSGKPSDQGKPGSNKQGAGDSSKKPGMEEQGDPSNPGEPGDERGEGSKKAEGEKKEGSGKPGNESGMPGESSESSEAGDPGDAKPGDTPGGASKPGDDPKGGTGTTRGGANQGPAGEAGTDGGDVSEAEKANLEYNKKAANLVLKRLQEQVENGEVDQKLLDEFGWTKEDMRRYLDRMKRTIDKPAEDKSPETESQRRQIEEFLKGYKIRQGRSDRDRTTGGVEPLRRKQAPAEFRDAYEAYTRSLRRKASGRNRLKRP